MSRSKTFPRTTEELVFYTVYRASLGTFVILYSYVRVIPLEEEEYVVRTCTLEVIVISTTVVLCRLVSMVSIEYLLLVVVIRSEVNLVV